MFIRWKRRRVRRNNDVALEAVLVRSVRIQGRPRQRFVCYLGSIRARELVVAASVQTFWQHVAGQLTALTLDPVTRQALEHQLARVVPPLASESLIGNCRADEVADAARQTIGTTPPHSAAALPGGLYVRWRRRRLRRTPDQAWDAVLVRRVGHQAGTRQQVVGYLASIRARYHTEPAHRAWFWTRVDARLAVLALDAATRQAVEADLMRTIPRPTPEELADVATQRAALVQWAHQTFS